MIGHGFGIWNWRKRGASASATALPALLSASINDAGTYLTLTFNQPMYVVGSLADIVLYGNFRDLVPNNIDSGDGTPTIVFEIDQVYPGETFVLDVTDVFEDAVGNLYPPFSGFPVANGSTFPDLATYRVINTGFRRVTNTGDYRITAA